MSNVEKEFDPFAGESGFKDDYDGMVDDAWFATQENYGDTVMLHLKVVADDGEEVENRYPCGPDWATYDGGETVEHTKGDRKGFNKNTRYFGLIEAAMGLAGVEEVLRRRSAELAGKGPKAAALWKGLRFHWNVKTETKKFKDRDTGEMIERDVSVVLPTVFLGEGAGTTSPAATGSPSPAAAAAPAATPAPSADIDPGLRMQLQSAARKAGTYADFCDLALEIPGVVENQTVMGLVATEEFYASLKG